MGKITVTLYVPVPRSVLRLYCPEEFVAAVATMFPLASMASTEMSDKNAEDTESLIVPEITADFARAKFTLLVVAPAVTEIMLTVCDICPCEKEVVTL